MYQRLLQEIAQKRQKYGESMQAPASQDQISALRERAQRELQSTLPEPYLSLLTRNNGLDWNGTFILASEETSIAGFPDRFIRGFVDWNLLRRDLSEFNDLLVFGESGIDLYVYQISTSEYQIRDSSSLDVIEVFTSFDELIAEALRKTL